MRMRTSFLKKSRLFLAVSLLFAGILLVACDEKSSTLGVDMMPATDLLTREYHNYGVPTESYPVEDSVLARTSMSYLGYYTDLETETAIKGDFLSQYNIIEGTPLFPDSICNHTITGIEVRLYVDKFVGDSLQNFKVSVFELTNNLDPDADYYTNIDPEKYYDPNSEPLATKWFTLSDRTITQAEREASGYLRNIRITLPTWVGQKIYDGFRADRSKFASTNQWLKSGLPCSKGLYFRLDYGDGAIAYVSITQMNIYFRYYDSEYQRDTTGVSRLTSTEEVIEATSFANANLQPLLDDQTCTYIKSPAGIFTMATLPIDSISANDTINSASITFTRYNDVISSNFKLGIPEKLLMVRYDDYKNGYFEKYSKADDKTSFIAKYSSTGNNYTFTNVARLISTCLKEKQQGTQSPNYNKVLLIPVSTVYDTSNNLVKVNHDFSIGSARLVKGHTNTPGNWSEDETSNVLLKVIYSGFGR